MVRSDDDASVGAPSFPTPVAVPLPQRPGTEPGPPVDPGVKHGAYNAETSILYPANLSAAVRGKLIVPPHVLSNSRTDADVFAADGMKLQSVELRRWGDAAKSLGGFTLASISADRLVYELIATFDAPYTYRGNTWSFGKRITIIDAQTRASLYGQTGGRLTHSEHQDEMRRIQRQPPLHPN